MPPLSFGGLGMTQKVWFFGDKDKGEDQPTIGYCPDCDEIATWNNDKGLLCPICGTTELSIFHHDGASKYPEK